MSIRKNIPGHCPDGGPGPSGRTTVGQDFIQKFAEKSFLFKDIIRTGWHIVRTVARPLQVISL
jgi:hypothetical protein